MPDSKAIAKKLEVEMNSIFGSAFILACNTLGVNIIVNRIDQEDAELNYEIRLVEEVNSHNLLQVFQLAAQLVNYSEGLKYSYSIESDDNDSQEEGSTAYSPRTVFDIPS